MKIAVAGKGGVGKTFIAGTLARMFAQDGFEVLAVDNDPSMNLIYSLGMDPNLREKITPISQMNKLIEERTTMNAYGTGIYKANPEVSDIPDRFKVPGPDNLQLLVVGTIETPESGCFCAPNVLVRTLLSELILERNELVIIDFEAGIEHLGRGTSKGIDVMIIVTGAYQKSLDLTKKLLRLANELGIRKNFIIGNQISNEKGEQIIQNWCEQNNVDILGFIPRDLDVLDCEMDGKAPIDAIPTSKAVKSIKNIQRKLKEYFVSID